MNRSVAFTFCGHATFRSLASTISTVLVAASFVTALDDSLNAAEKPNVLLILADDLGWSDTTLYDTTTLYQTPDVERLAKRGMTFRRAYAVNGDQGAHQWRLYDLVHDVGERNDLAAQHPDIVRELDSRIDRFLTDTDARVPTANPDYKPRGEQPRTSPEPKERRPKPPSKKISLKPIPI
jgi:hypothetical protein